MKRQLDIYTLAHVAKALGWTMSDKHIEVIIHRCMANACYASTPLDEQLMMIKRSLNGFGRVHPHDADGMLK